MANNVHDIVNEERRKRRLSHVYWSREMARLAKSQANYCARVNRLVHSKDIPAPGGENIAQGGPNFTPRQIVDCWLQSRAGHRENLLNPAATKAGVGIAHSNRKTFVAWTYSCVSPTFPDCPHYRSPKAKHSSSHNRSRRDSGGSLTSILKDIRRRTRCFVSRIRRGIPGTRH
jgi:hypothetical protein